MEHLLKETPDGLQLQVTVQPSLGLHARPAARIVQEMQKFAAEVIISRDNVNADAKSILDIMALAATAGSVLTVRATGSDARQALLRIAELFSASFKE